MNPHLSCLYREKALIIKTPANQRIRSSRTMASSLLDLTAEIVIAHASVTEITSDELLKEIKMVYATLEGLEKSEESVSIEMPAQEPKNGRKNSFLRSGEYPS
jgi:predicted transcriptional regulator